jgi:hypothetical protein
LGNGKCNRVLLLDYKRPELKTTDLYQNEVVSTDTTSLYWNKIFTDSLLQAIFQKVTNNLDIRFAMQNIGMSYMKQGKRATF